MSKVLPGILLSIFSAFLSTSGIYMQESQKHIAGKYNQNLDFSDRCNLLKTQGFLFVMVGQIMKFAIDGLLPLSAGIINDCRHKFGDYLINFFFHYYPSLFFFRSRSNDISNSYIFHII